MKSLLDLQRVDSAIDRLRQRKADLPEQRALDELAAELEGAGSSRAAVQAQLDEIARDQGKLEGELSTIEEKIRHESERLYGGDITSPKELANIQAELDGLRRRKNHLEDQDLEVLERREAVEKELGELATRHDELVAKAAEASAARDAAAVEIENDLASNEATRAEITPGLPDELHELYADLRVKKDGVGAAALEKGVCRGCGVALSPVALDGIRRAAPEEIVRCENCRRILIPV